MDMQIEERMNDLAAYLFHQGTNYRAQDYMGVHRVEGGYLFRVWAPRATRVFAVGTFNRWEDTLPMTRTTKGGIWEAFLPESHFGEGMLYKFKLETENGVFYKADPYARAAGLPPETASVYLETEDYAWQDEGWMSFRHRAMSPQKLRSRPVNIYELHLGSWKRYADGRYYTYEETARELIPYVKQMGYTHIGLLPVTEHTDEGSWGYLTTGYFAPTARYGTPKDFMAFVDAMHGAGIGVILDWVVAQFPTDEHALVEFDGSPLYECAETAKPSAVCRFDISRREVECFLISSVGFWADAYHIDGIRIASAPTLCRGRMQEGLAFLRRLNTMMSTRHSDVLMIAESLGETVNLTTFADGGVGFDMGWNGGWMHDVPSYFTLPFDARCRHHRALTFSMMYAFREHYLLACHHDAAALGSMHDRMAGDEWQKFAGCRALLGYMMTHPGKKMLFMGEEIGARGAWHGDREIDWSLTDREEHAALQRYVAELNHLYLTTPALHETDDSWAGFAWIDADNHRQSVISFRRIDERGREVIVVINFTPTAYENYCVGVPDAGVYEEIFNSDDRRFGGSGVINEGTLRTRPERLHNLPDILNFRLPPLGMAIFRCRRKQPRKK